MRLALWLSIATFSSTLFWPHLLNSEQMLWAVLLFLVLLLIPRLKALAVIPFFIVYFSLYASLSLTGKVTGKTDMTPINKLPIFQSAIFKNTFENTQSLAHYADKKDHSIIFKVKSLINEENKGYFRGELKEVDGELLNYSPLVEVRWYNAELNFQDGQQVHIKGKFKPIYGRGNPGGFDRQKWLYSEHIGYQVSIKKLVSVINADISIRAKLYIKVKNALSDFDNKGILLALSFADKTLISSDTKRMIRELGISHLFAISGLHIGLFFGFICFLVNLGVARLLPAEYLGWFSWRLVNTIALIGALFYAYLAGFSLPTQRAFLMLLFAVMILSMKRKSSIVDIIGLTLFLVLLWDPLAVMGLSLWLSFFAVSIIIFILWVSPLDIASNQSLPFGQKIISYIKGLTFIQLALSFLMLPIQILSFSAVNIMAPLINLFAIPLFSLLIIPCILLGTFLSMIFSNDYFDGVGSLFFIIADQAVSAFFSLALFLQQYYQSISDETGMIIIFSLCCLICGVVCYLFFSQRRIILLIYFSCLLSLYAILSIQKNNLNEQQWTIETIDVGQGLSVLIKSQGETLLYDAGPRYPSGFTTASVEIVPYFQKQGIEQLDYLLISHSDSDHAGGFDVINQNYSPRHIILGEPLNKSFLSTVNARSCNAGESWKLGLLTIHVLSPFKRGKNNNNNSCVLKITDGSFSLLLTGDIDKKQEKKLVEEYGDLLKSDLLFAPHHGSKHSSSSFFIKNVAPQSVVFSTGFLNHWGFPAQKTQERYLNQSVNMINSGTSGFIRYTVSKRSIKIETYREDLSPYWYHHLQ